MQKPRSKAANPGFEEVFAALKSVINKHAKDLTVSKDTHDWYYTDIKGKTFRGKPLCFAGVRLGKGYVSYYLMPTYMSPKMQSMISPELKKRMQGKACFNFKQIDEPLFKELAKLTSVGLKAFKKLDEGMFK